MEAQDRRDRLLREAPRDTLIRLLRSAAIGHPELAIRIEAAALAADPVAVEAFLSRQIGTLPRPDGWFTDDEGAEYTRLWIDPIIDAVRDDLLPIAPAAAARVLCELLSLDEEILQRVDTSYGGIMLRLGWITEILIEAAKQEPRETIELLQEIQLPDDPLFFRREVLQDVQATLP